MRDRQLRNHFSHEASDFDQSMSEGSLYEDSDEEDGPGEGEEAIDEADNDDDPLFASSPEEKEETFVDVGDHNDDDEVDTEVDNDEECMGGVWRSYSPVQSPDGKPDAKLHEERRRKLGEALRTIDKAYRRSLSDVTEPKKRVVTDLNSSSSSRHRRQSSSSSATSAAREEEAVMRPVQSKGFAEEAAAAILRVKSLLDTATLSSTTSSIAIEIGEKASSSPSSQPLRKASPHQPGLRLDLNSQRSDVRIDVVASNEKKDAKEPVSSAVVEEGNAIWREAIESGQLPNVCPPFAAPDAEQPLTIGIQSPSPSQPLLTSAARLALASLRREWEERDRNELQCRLQRQRDICLSVFEQLQRKQTDSSPSPPSQAAKVVAQSTQKDVILDQVPMALSDKVRVDIKTVPEAMPSVRDLRLASVFAPSKDSLSTALYPASTEPAIKAIPGMSSQHALGALEKRESEFVATTFSPSAVASIRVSGQVSDVVELIDRKGDKRKGWDHPPRAELDHERPRATKFEVSFDGAASSTMERKAVELRREAKMEMLRLRSEHDSKTRAEVAYIIILLPFAPPPLRILRRPH